MLEAALASLRQILTPPFRSVLYKSLGLTLLLLALACSSAQKVTTWRLHRSSCLLTC
jgi:CysZ protein